MKSFSFWVRMALSDLREVVHEVGMYLFITLIYLVLVVPLMVIGGLYGMWTMFSEITRDYWGALKDVR